MQTIMIHLCVINVLVNNDSYLLRKNKRGLDTSFFSNLRGLQSPFQYNLSQQLQHATIQLKYSII